MRAAHGPEHLAEDAHPNAEVCRGRPRAQEKSAQHVLVAVCRVAPGVAGLLEDLDEEGAEAVDLCCG